MSFFDKMNQFSQSTSNLFNSVSGGIANVGNATRNIKLPTVQTTVGLDNKTMMLVVGSMAISGIVLIKLLIKKK